MEKLNYITNIDRSKKSGGVSGLNNAVFTELKKYYDVQYIGPITARTDIFAKLISKFYRIFFRKGKYHFFSEKRLLEIKSNAEILMKPAKVIFFNGFTPWIKIKPNQPYYCFNDACFASYVEIYNNRNSFTEKDLHRIFSQEKKWLNNAKKVFFSSYWALEETKNKYNLKGENFEFAGIAGFIDIPKHDVYKTGYNFLFISKEFIPKGGMTAVKALQILRKSYLNVNLWVVGDKPNQEILKQDGIIYKGSFDKNIEKENEELKAIFKNAFALIHPTLKDTTTLVITELAYYGCPAISTNKFAIPEYLLDGKTGFLLEDPRNEKELANKMANLIEDSVGYKRMRICARENAIKNNTWEKVGGRIANSIDSL